jgi:hypothetical protein
MMVAATVLGPRASNRMDREPVWPPEPAPNALRAGPLAG